MKHYKYTGPPDKAFEGEIWYTIEYTEYPDNARHPKDIRIKFSELKYSISYTDFIVCFEEITEQDKFHKKLLGLVTDECS